MARNSDYARRSESRVKHNYVFEGSAEISHVPFSRDRLVKQVKYNSDRWCVPWYFKVNYCWCELLV